MNRTDHTDTPEQYDSLTRSVYEAPRVIRLDEVAPETGDYTKFNENTGGMLES
jgi:hypothetical protein